MIINRLTGRNIIDITVYVKEVNCNLVGGDNRRRLHGCVRGSRAHREACPCSGQPRS